MSDTSALVYIDPSSGLEIRELSFTQDGEAALILGPLGPPESFRTVPKAMLFGAHLDHVLVGIFALQRDGMANLLGAIAVREDHRRQGIGRTMLQDALRRSGERPLVVQTPEPTLGFFKACGFKMVGRRVQPDGAVHFRMGWHAPGAHFKGGTTSALEHQPLTLQEEGPSGS